VKNFESTETLMRLLKQGKYPRHIMENKSDDEALDYDIALSNYKSFTSRPDNYDYLTQEKKRVESTK